MRARAKAPSRCISSRSTPSPEKFAFLKEVGGDVIGAGTGAELRQALDGIYQGKILAEAPAPANGNLSGSNLVVPVSKEPL